jgi:DICT domain-containing protein
LQETEPGDCAALRSDEVLTRDSDGPAKPGGLCDDLIERVYGFWPADLGDRLHVFAVLEKRHAERYRPQLQKTLEVCNQFGPIPFHIGLSAGVRSRHQPLSARAS